MITIRLNERLERTLETLAVKQGLTKSALVRQCLEEFVTRNHIGESPWDIGKELFGKYGSGRGDLSIHRKKIVREKIHAKRHSN